MFLIFILSSFLQNTIDCYTVSRIPGHFNIGMLLSIRAPPMMDSPYEKCGEIQEVTGIQRLEAALMALEMINNSTKILPGVTLGIEVCDTCWLESLAIRQSLYLIGNAFTINNSGSFGEGDAKQCKMFPKSSVFNKSSIIGVIGSDTSVKATPVQNLFNLFNIPQIGAFHSIAQSNNKDILSTLLHIGPCRVRQVEVVRDILKKFDWTYVATIHTSGLGEVHDSSFRNLIKKDGKICIFKDFAIKTTFSDTDIDDVIKKISKNKSLSVIVSFCEGVVLRQLFDAIIRLNLTDRFTFITSDLLVSPIDVIQELQEHAWGTISVSAEAPPIPTFFEYYKSLKPSENKRNPWFSEFWEDKFNCTLSEKQSAVRVDTKYISGVSDSRKFCSGNESLAGSSQVHRRIGYMMKMMWALAHGLHSLMIEICGQNYHGVCQKMYPFSTLKLMDHLRNLSFEYENELVKINDKSVTSSYVILNYQKTSDNNFNFIKIGDWENGTLKLSTKWQSRQNEPVISICSTPCQIGFHKVFRGDNNNPNCCWDCEACNVDEYVSTDEEHCMKCSRGETLNSNRTGCVKIPVHSRDWSESTTVMIVTFTITGVIATLITFYIFVKYKDTPVVKASSTELCYMILCSMIICHISVFITLAEPTEALCALSRIVPDIGLMMLYASLFMKSNRIARILALSTQSFPKKKRRLMSTSSQVAIVLFCVAFEIIVCFAMLPINPPRMSEDYSSQERAVIICNVSILDTVPTVFVTILYTLCIVYAIKTRNVPGNFNEAKFMGFTMLFSTVTSLFFITLYFGTQFKVPTFCMCLTLNASFALIFLFFPKLYIIIFKPEKNNKSLFITNKSIRTHIGSYFDSNIMESSSQYSPKFQTENDFVTPENKSRLRRNVSIQTNSELFCNMSSSSDDNNEQLFSADDSDNDNSRNNNINISPKSDRNIVKIINNAQERGTNSMSNEFNWRAIFLLTWISKCLNYFQFSNFIWYIRGTKRKDCSLKSTPKSWIELNVNNFRSR